MTDQAPEERAGIFYPATLGEPQRWEVNYKGLVYPGEVIATEKWDPGWGSRLTGNVSFRIIFLTAPSRISRPSIRDGRIALVLPGRQATSVVRQGLQREVRAIREARALYVTTRGAGA